MMRGRGNLAGAVFVDYGQPAAYCEQEKAEAYCKRLETPLRVVTVGGAALGDMGSGSGARVVPGRNLLLLALAANLLPEMGGDTLAIGCNHADRREYVDCREAFLRSASEAIGVPVYAPVLHMTKRHVVAMARSMGIGRLDTWCCYGGGATRCGACPSCDEDTAGWSR